MKGTEKQIKWAEDIKAGAYNALTCLDHNIDHYESVGHKKDYSRDSLAVIREQLDATFASIDYAGKIIDMRDMFTQSRLEKIAIGITNGLIK